MDAITQVKQLMLESYKSPHSIEELCELVGESYHTFRKQFRRVEGITLSEDYQRLRLQEAERLLGDSEKRIFEVVSEIGLSDEGNFTNWFKKKTGLTPTAYRHQLERRGVGF